MNILDYIYLGLIAGALILGLWKGFLKQVFALVGIFVVSIGTTYLAPFPNLWLQSAIPNDGTRSLVAMIITFIALTIIYGIITKFISKLINKTPILGWVNRLLGAVFGILAVYFAFSFFVALIVGTSDEFLVKFKELLYPQFSESWIVQKIYGGYDNPEKNFFGNWLMKVLQEEINSIMPSLPQTPVE